MTVKFVLPRHQHFSWRIVEVLGLTLTDEGYFNRKLKLEGKPFSIYSKDLFDYLLRQGISKQLENSEEIKLRIPSSLLVKEKKLVRKKPVTLTIRKVK